MVLAVDLLVENILLSMDLRLDSIDVDDSQKKICYFTI